MTFSKRWLPWLGSCCFAVAGWELPLRAQPAGWAYQSFQIEAEQTSARLIHSASGAVARVSPGESFEGYQVVAVSSSQVTLEKEETVYPLLIEQNTADESLSRKVVGLSVKRTPLRDLLGQLARYSGLRLVAAENLSGTVSMDLSNMTVKEVLDLICRHHDLQFRAVGGTLWVYPQSEDPNADRTEKSSSQ